MPRTRNHFVHLYASKSATDYEPAVILPPGTHVGMLPHEQPKAGFTIARLVPVVALVEPTQQRWREGWLRTTDLADNIEAPSMVSSSLTGRSYGAYPHAWNGAPLDLWTTEDMCKHCDAEREQHRLLETTVDGLEEQIKRWSKPLRTVSPGTIENATSNTQKDKLRKKYQKEDEGRRTAMIDAPRLEGTIQDALRLYQALMNKEGLTVKGDKMALGYSDTTAEMIGVLQVADSDNVYASHSGQHSNAGFAKVAESLGFIYAGPVTGTVRNRSGAQAARSAQDVSQYKCAAPRLIHAAIQAGEWPYSMTEVWFEPSKSHAIYPDRHTIESCDNCRKIVPLMLCPD
ncbi:hypothetical protein D187_007576 [Cystobacter fuscus DSM 2262]|uniref:Uncharacterized protein n=1 Tax=Cystobacter fuscus (strain ATCC 25194 / DSM 2262 / NBRC 100088 / M29) TaxID=1242864 RepID=S9Q4I2_CYSF2|nr:hypothetical protein [Cystobacter fuscus]EPX56234.1 hypothetical protein D187_007576 [Cystobacter fuscus DSM 2262]